MKFHSFFDRAAVIAKLDPAKRKALSKAGAYVRRTAKGLMRKRKGHSPPGKPPAVIKGSLKRRLFFAFDRTSESVVIGPEKFGMRKFIGKPVPAVHEFGGRGRSRLLPLDKQPTQATYMYVRNRYVAPMNRRPSRYTPRNQRLRYLPGKRTRPARYPKRPYMRPALEKEIAKGSLPKAFQNIVRR